MYVQNWILMDVNGMAVCLLFDETARNVCCWAEVGGINPSCASHEMGCVEIQGLGYFITGYK